MDPSFIHIITFSGRAAANYCSLKLQNPPSPVWKRSRCAILHKVKPTPPPSLSLSPLADTSGNQDGYCAHFHSTPAQVSSVLSQERPPRAVYCFQMESRSAAMPADDHLLAPSRNPAFSLRNLFRMHSTRRLRGSFAVGFFAVLRRLGVRHGLN